MMDTDYYYITSQYALVPQMLSERHDYTESFSAMFGTGPHQTIESLPLPEHRAVLWYAFPNNLRDRIQAADAADASEPPVRIYPLIRKLLHLAGTIPHHNKAVLFYRPAPRQEDGSREQGEKPALHLVLQEGDRLLLANSYPASHFNTALYFLLLAVRQIQMNPEQTHVRVCSPLGSAEKATIEKYFREAEIRPLGPADRLIPF